MENILDQNKIATKFVDSPAPFEQLKNSVPYILKVKILEGKKLTRQEKNALFRQLHHNNRFKRAIPLLGWRFDFSSILKTFFVQYTHGHIEEVLAPDKMAIRNCESQIQRIVEVNN